MSNKHSAASKARWAKIGPEERSKIMSEKVKARWAKATKADRLAQARKMVAGHKKK